MDQLVRQYTRSPHQNEFYSEQEQHDLTESLPPLSLKFALPPVANVSSIVVILLLWPESSLGSVFDDLRELELAD